MAANGEKKKRRWSGMAAAGIRRKCESAIRRRMLSEGGREMADWRRRNGLRRPLANCAGAGVKGEEENRRKCISHRRESERLLKRPLEEMEAGRPPIREGALRREKAPMAVQQWERKLSERRKSQSKKWLKKEMKKAIWKSSFCAKRRRWRRRKWNAKAETSERKPKAKEESESGDWRQIVANESCGSWNWNVGWKSMKMAPK